MNHIERIEQAVETAEYQTYGAMAGAALAAALLAPDQAQMDEGLKQYNELLKKQAAIVKRATDGAA